MSGPESGAKGPGTEILGIDSTPLVPAAVAGPAVRVEEFVVVEVLEWLSDWDKGLRRGDSVPLTFAEAFPGPIVVWTLPVILALRSMLGFPASCLDAC